MTTCSRDEFLTNLFITGDCHLFSICILRAVEGKQNKTKQICHGSEAKMNTIKGHSNFYQMSIMGTKFWKKTGQSGHDSMCVGWELQRDKHSVRGRHGLSWAVTEGRTPSGACGARARGCVSASAGGACPPPRSSRSTSWASPLLRKTKNQNLQMYKNHSLQNDPCDTAH